jgi:hypothetical protein
MARPESSPGGLQHIDKSVLRLANYFGMLPDNGGADSLDEAKAASGAAGERQRPLSKERADEKFSLSLSVDDPISNDE